MDDAFGMRGGQSGRQLARGAEEVVPRRSPSRANLLAERVAVHEFTRDEQIAVDLLERIDRADAGMRQRRRRARFTAEPLALRRIARQVRRERLERDRSSQPRVGGQIHASHPASSDLPDDGVNTHHCPWRERPIVGKQIGRVFDDRRGKERARARVVLHERQHLSPHGGIVCRFALDPRGNIGGIALHRHLEQIANSTLLFGRHAPLSSRKSQARASAKRRFRVAGDIPSASAVSSMLRPAK